MLLGHDYFYAMKVVVSTLFHVMHFPHNGNISTIDKISSDNHHPGSNLAQVSPLCVSSVRVDSSPPRVNYVVSYPRCSISPEIGFVWLCYPSREKVLMIDKVLYAMGVLKQSLFFLL
jgi:hypothetical protein